MILLDTHAWVWWCTASSLLSPRASKAIRAEDVIGVSPISCWEVGMLVTKKRIDLDRDVEVWVDQALKLPKVRLLPLTPRIALKSTMLGEAFHGDPADRILVATASEHGVPLVSKDKRISSFPGLKVIW
jgi:PIN domain nuclease of toxin-antitoxin system